LAAQRFPLPGTRSARRGRRGGTAHGVRDLKYQSGFKQFDYVNANAPKGGRRAADRAGTDDNFNMVIDGVSARRRRHRSYLRHLLGRRSMKYRADMGSAEA
jgi:hypothetical protein